MVPFGVVYLRFVLTLMYDPINMVQSGAECGLSGLARRAREKGQMYHTE